MKNTKIEIKEKKNIKVEMLFPIPIVFIDLGRELTEIEKDAILQNTNDTYKSIGNLASTNKYILNDKKLNNLKEFFLQECHNYFKNFCDPKNNIDFYITQSWLSITNFNEYHQPHKHANSFLSGVFYVEADEELDDIVFYNSVDSFIFDFDSIARPMYFAQHWRFKVKKNTLIIFPSTLTHGVRTKTSKNSRISLAFNTFVKGTFGAKEDSSELILT